MNLTDADREELFSIIGRKDEGVICFIWEIEQALSAHKAERARSKQTPNESRDALLKIADRARQLRELLDTQVAKSLLLGSLTVDGGVQNPLAFRQRLLADLEILEKASTAGASDPSVYSADKKKSGRPPDRAKYALAFNVGRAFMQHLAEIPTATADHDTGDGRFAKCLRVVLGAARTYEPRHMKDLVLSVVTELKNPTAKITVTDNEMP